MAVNPVSDPDRAGGSEQSAGPDPSTGGPVAVLNSGVRIPMLGLGVYQTPPGDATEKAVRWALEAGYRHIDTAAAYGNERDVGRAIRHSGISRGEIFVTTKLNNRDHGRRQALAAFEKSLEKLGMDYIDLYLIHWPVPELRDDSWRTLQELAEEGRARAIGVSNYQINHLEQLLSWAETVPAVNQIELSPYLNQRKLLEFCRKNGIWPEAYSPLTRGRRFDDPRLRAIAERAHKSPAQVLIRWALQHDLIVIPKSARRERIVENADVFDFELSAGDMATLDGLDEDLRLSWDPTKIG